MKNLVSIAALAIASISTPVFADHHEGKEEKEMAAPTVADAEAFIAAAEADLFDFSVEGAKVAWINSTYITEDTDAIAAKYGAVGTEKSVKYALEAAKISKKCRGFLLRPSASSTSCAAGLFFRRQRLRAQQPN